MHRCFGHSNTHTLNIIVINKEFWNKQKIIKYFFSESNNRDTNKQTYTYTRKHAKYSIFEYIVLSSETVAFNVILAIIHNCVSPSGISCFEALLFNCYLKHLQSNWFWFVWSRKKVSFFDLLSVQFFSLIAIRLCAHISHNHIHKWNESFFLRFKVLHTK